MRQKITCPETAHLEEIEFSESPIDGTIVGVHRCSRFHPEGLVDCDGLCAQRLNQRLESRGRPGPENARKEADPAADE